MHTLIGLLVAAATACAVARPPGPSAPPVMPQLYHRIPHLPPRPYLGDYLMPPLQPNYLSYEDSIRSDLPTDEHVWLNKEIDRLSQMEDEEGSLTPFEVQFSRWMTQDPYMAPMIRQDLPDYLPDTPRGEDLLTVPPSRGLFPPKVEGADLIKSKLPKLIESRQMKDAFAMTPLEEGYYEPEEKVLMQQPHGPQEGGVSQSIEMEPPREIRQNPNLGRTKNLIAENIERLRTGFTQEMPEGTHRPPQEVQVLESMSDGESIYGMILIATVGAAMAMVVFGFAFGWYTLSRKAKAAADVDYPAYGVTGPTMDTSGDRKLAHSAHMYHYQHQKQQIIAMERNGLEQRNGSISDPESEEENEEGDYTVYECPGFATTGEMEVKNPLFLEEPTPPTPGKCEIVKPQPKE